MRSEFQKRIRQLRLNAVLKLKRKESLWFEASKKQENHSGGDAKANIQ